MSQTLSVRNPRTGEDDYEIDPLDESAIESIAADVRRSQRAWVSAGVAHRCAVISQWCEALLASPEPVVSALSADTGRRLIAAVEVQGLRGVVNRWCKSAPAILAEKAERASEAEGVGVQGQLVPYSLVGVISPWNFPFLLSMLDSIPALIAGCGVIVKPSEVTPRFIAPLIRSLDAFPDLASVFRWIEGDGPTGAALINNVDAIAFTGSVATGRKVAESCARNFIPAFLELGGKDPVIVMPDADLEKAAAVILRASVQATGQACQSLERVYVHESGFDRFVDSIVRQAKAIELNFPDIKHGQIGPLIFAKQAGIIAGHLDDARSKGATVHCGGEIEHHGGGTWIRPTVVTGVDHSMQVMTEETFGPVIPVMAYRDIDEAIDLANDTRYGLSAAVFGPDVEAALAIGRQLNAGAISINDGGLTTDVHDATHDSFLFSGMGQARMGETGITRFMREKALLIRHSEPRTMADMEESLLP